MAPTSTAASKKAASGSPAKIDPSQTLRATTALLRKIQADESEQKTSASKSNLLEDADEEDVEDDSPVWLILTTKKHIVDKKRLKPGKIVLPHPLRSVEDASLRICLITADPQRKYKDLIAEPSFPLDVSKKISRVIGLEKLKSKYKSYESKRQLVSEYDIFLADDRIITYLPTVLGKVFYKGGSKRPIPVTLEGKRESVDEQGNKRKRLAEGGEKVTKKDVRPRDVAEEVKRAIGAALVHLAPSTTTAMKVGKASMTPEQVQANVDATVEAMVEKYVPQKWSNMRAVHIKGPETAALPIWMTEELWANEHDVLDEAPSKEIPGKKRKRGALTNGEADVIEVPGPDGKMRREEVEAKAQERAEKTARKEALKKQKDAVDAKAITNGDSNKPGKKAKKSKA
ncbi:uncharacterized protein MYCFIDRAFT_29407 [Pseudocercospora fijiensis CIRAD86]|uniref:Ribosomal protein L1 n=1 Tax=Pseudocercospora fijiensis (strain CIRAD86) TaxID=383855 RepID=M2ZAP2_PSEFD|nr:uncharacterized protein MYCFIDRAFT_29407 [Pseudocercospora fijiensis CIRAD86]EME86890.1 hypothetical protein MYCFIDRAFT_29407 [Pseudocercospora fijiensis CIRAD86]